MKQNYTFILKSKCQPVLHKQSLNLNHASTRLANNPSVSSGIFFLPVIKFVKQAYTYIFKKCKMSIVIYFKQQKKKHHQTIDNWSLITGKRYLNKFTNVLGDLTESLEPNSKQISYSVLFSLFFLVSPFPQSF